MQKVVNIKKVVQMVMNMSLNGFWQYTENTDGPII